MSVQTARSATQASGVAFAVLAMACFAVMDVTNKVLVAGMPLLMALWFRYMFQALATTVAVLPRRGWALFHTRQPWRHVLRGVLLFLCSLLAFINLQHMPVAEFTAIGMLTPLVITVLAAWFFHERVSALRWLLVAGGFSGAMIIIRPGAEQFSLVFLLPFLVLVANSLFQLLTSRMVRTEDPLTMHLYTGWVGTLVSSVALPWSWAALSAWQWGLMVLMGLSASIGHLLLILAFERTAVATIAPYMYAQIAFAVIGGWLVFSHTPDGWSLIGMGLIAACGAAGAWLTMREHRSLRAALARPPDT